MSHQRAVTSRTASDDARVPAAKSSSGNSSHFHPPNLPPLPATLMPRSSTVPSDDSTYRPVYPYGNQRAQVAYPPLYANPQGSVHSVPAYVMQQRHMHPLVSGTVASPVQLAPLINVNPAGMGPAPLSYRTASGAVAMPLVNQMQPVGVVAHHADYAGMVHVGYQPQQSGIVVHQQEAVASGMSMENGYFVPSHASDGYAMYTHLPQTTPSVTTTSTQSASRSGENEHGHARVEALGNSHRVAHDQAQPHATAPEPPDQEELLNDIAEKRRRNADASARFRDRRRKREHDMRDRCKQLEKRVADLEEALLLAREELQDQRDDGNDDRKRKRTLIQDVSEHSSSAGDSVKDDATYKQQKTQHLNPDTPKRITRSLAKSMDQRASSSMSSTSASAAAAVPSVQSQITVVGSFPPSSSGSDAYASPMESGEDV